MRRTSFVLAGLILVAGVLPDSSPFRTYVEGVALIGAAHADDAGDSRAERAERLRRQSEHRSGAHLGYETVGDPNKAGTRDVDYYALGALISRLGMILQQIEEGRRAASAAPLPGLPGGAGQDDPVRRTYGPTGPTVQSVSALLSYRLVQLGNPNLKAGPVTDEGEHIIATVVTREGSLVARYRIDKRSGDWQQTPPNG